LTADDSPNPRGAICVRGPNVCVERWNEPSAELRDGWLELPIYGEMLANAALSVLGSRSSVVRSSQSPSGTVFLEQLERVFASSSAVVNVCVVGRSSRLDVVVYPRPMELFAAAKRLKKEYRLNQIADYPWCADYMRDCLLEAARSEGVEWAAHADIRVNLVSVPFSLQNGFVLADGSNNRSAIQKSLDAKNYYNYLATLASATPAADHASATEPKQADPNLNARGWDYYKWRRNNIPAEQLNERGWDYYKWRRSNIPAKDAKDINERGWDYYKARRSDIPAENLNERGWDYYKWRRSNIPAEELNARGLDYYKP
ncbi:hypothetical protein EV180_006180, partial [Coemansia sp. RSA 518]